MYVVYKPGTTDTSLLPIPALNSYLQIRLLYKPVVIMTDPVLALRVLGHGKTSFPKAPFAYDGAINVSIGLHGRVL